MFDQQKFSFTADQMKNFQKRHGKLLASWQALEGPVVPVHAALSSAGQDFTIGDGDALLDTGCDYTCMLLEWVKECCLRERRPLPSAELTHEGLLVSADDVKLSLLVSGSSHPVRPPSGKILLVPAQKWPGYEPVLIGRDVLRQFTFCFSHDSFSLIGQYGQCCVPIRRSSP
jgi:hypothetical protein